MEGQQQQGSASSRRKSIVAERVAATEEAGAPLDGLDKFGK